MEIALDKDTLAWRAKARDFVEQALLPWELEAEFNQGVIPPEVSRRHEQQAIELGFSRMDTPARYGGLQLSCVKQVAIWEQLGRVTNALCWCFSEPQQWMFEACNEAQLKTWILPLISGARKECYAITEAESGSWEVINTRAEQRPDGYLINGEKRYVTSANHADYFFLQARLEDGGQALFFVDLDTPGVTMTDNPKFSHTYAAHHPTFRFQDVLAPVGNRIGADGAGMDYTRSWYRHERMMIAARCCGAAARLIEEASEFAAQRRILDETLADQQAIRFMLADSATELWAARLMTYEAAQAHDRGVDLKSLHTRCSMVKLFASEMANRVADRALQIFGARGYMRTNVAERFFRELRVDRIWEGPSEIQRLVIANRLLKCGLEEM